MPLNQTFSALEQHDEFIGRHIGPCTAETTEMLAAIGAASLEQLIDQTVPAAIRLPADLPLAPHRAANTKRWPTSRPWPARTSSTNPASAWAITTR